MLVVVTLILIFSGGISAATPTTTTTTTTITTTTTDATAAEANSTTTTVPPVTTNTPSSNTSSDVNTTITITSPATPDSESTTNASVTTTEAPNNGTPDATNDTTTTSISTTAAPSNEATTAGIDNTTTAANGSAPEASTPSNEATTSGLDNTTTTANGSAPEASTPSNEATTSGLDNTTTAANGSSPEATDSTSTPNTTVITDPVTPSPDNNTSTDVTSADNSTSTVTPPDGTTTDNGNPTTQPPDVTSADNSTSTPQPPDGTTTDNGTSDDNGTSTAQPPPDVTSADNDTTTDSPDSSSVATTTQVNESVTTTTDSPSEPSGNATEPPSSSSLPPDTTPQTNVPESTTPTAPSTTSTVTTTTPDPCQGLVCVEGDCVTVNETIECQCHHGYTGDNCTSDIDECLSDPCGEHATCTNTPGSYTCACEPGYTHNATSVCIDVDECTSTPCDVNAECTNTIGSYTCACNDGYTGNGTHCTDINECEDNPDICSPHSNCTNVPGSFECVCQPGYTADTDNTCIDIDECSTGIHLCDKHATCSNTDGNYTCTCKSGLNGTGYICTDIDECSEADACKNGQCYNYVGSYRCFCLDGWTGTICDTDINECNSTDKPCADGAVCTDTTGSYNCTCPPGYKGDGYIDKCIQEVLILASGGQTFVGDDEVFGAFTLDEDIAYFGSIYNRFYVSINGYVTLGRSLRRRFPPSTSGSWEQSRFPIIAPLWSDIQTGSSTSDSAVTVSQLKKDDPVLKTINDVLDSSITLSNAVVVTWRNAVPYPYRQNANFESADFQAILASDGTQTFLMYNYDQERFSWSTSNKHVAIGYSLTDFSGRIAFDTDDFVGANKDSNTVTDKVNGRWIYNVTATEESWRSESECLSMVADVDIRNMFDYARRRARPCPCSYWQAIRDRNFRYYGVERNIIRFRSRFRRWPHNHYQLCHYSWYTYGLTKGSPYGGYLDIPETSVRNACCGKDGESRQCNLFYNMNPSDTCQNYRPPSWGWSWGDPHITTADGASYTFNGRGEYVLLKSDAENATCEIQVRTETLNTTADATIFVGVAAQNGKDGDVIEIVLDTTTQSATININGELNTTFSSSPASNVSIEAEGIEVENTDDVTLSITMETGVAIKVVVSSILDVIVSVPQDGHFKGSTVGLLGNTDGDVTNDFVWRNGTESEENATEEELFEFGSSWQTTYQESLFSYTTAQNYSYYNNDSIRPTTFISDLNVTERAAYLTDHCGGSISFNESTDCGANVACIVDTLASCKKEFGQDSRNTEESAVENKAVSDNNPPVIVASGSLCNDSDPSVLCLYYGHSASIVLTVADDSDAHPDITVTVNGTATNANLQLNITAEQTTSLRNRNETFWLMVTATDSQNSSTDYRPSLYYCGCEEKSQCDYSLIQQDGGNQDNLFHARCNCTDNSQGDFCETLYDTCSEITCLDNITCDSSLEKPCGECPAGYNETDKGCINIDECRLNISTCSQICTDTPGSYVCSCESGYRQENNDCKDINECVETPDVCNATQYCDNTPGNYSCKCIPDYIESTSGDCVRVGSTFGGKLSITVVKVLDSHELEVPIVDIAEHLLLEFNQKKLSVVSVDVVSITKTSQTARRKRSEPAVDNYEVAFVLHSAATDLTTQQVQTAFEGINPAGNNYQIDLDTSAIITDADGGVCAITGQSNCDLQSTVCNSTNGYTSCVCRPGYHNLDIYGHRCEDEDECLTAGQCEPNGECRNLPGEFTCDCDNGFVFDGTSNCVDTCLSNPCKNGGTCIRGQQEAQYVCQCGDDWTGPNCGEENSEAKKLRIIAIVVGCVLGAVCVLLLCAMFGMYRRHRRKYGGYYNNYSSRGHLPTLDDEYDIDMTRSSPFKKDDFPIDDNNGTSFSIPRPKYTTNEYDVSTNVTPYRNSAGSDGAGAKTETQEEADALTTTTSGDSQHVAGIENPSFVHAQDTDKRQSTRSNKNNYEYF